MRAASDVDAHLARLAALVSGAVAGSDQDDVAIVAEGRASAQLAAPFKEFVLPSMEGLAALMSGPAPAMLDVGVGAGGLAVAFCRLFPRLGVVGIDVLPRALELARAAAAEAHLDERIELRLQDVSRLEDRHAFCLAWLPMPFVSRTALEAGLPRVVASLVPGGWVLAGHMRRSEDGLAGFQTVAFGSTALDDAETRELLRAAGLERVATLPTPEDAPALSVGRRPLC